MGRMTVFTRLREAAAKSAAVLRRRVAPGIQLGDLILTIIIAAAFYVGFCVALAIYG